MLADAFAAEQALESSDRGILVGLARLEQEQGNASATETIAVDDLVPSQMCDQVDEYIGCRKSGLSAFIRYK